MGSDARRGAAPPRMVHTHPFRYVATMAIVLVLDVSRVSSLGRSRSLTCAVSCGTGSDSASGGDAGSVAAVLRGFTPRVWEMYVTRRVNLRHVDDFAAVRGGRSLTFDEWAEGLAIGQVDEVGLTL